MPFVPSSEHCSVRSESETSHLATLPPGAELSDGPARRKGRTALRSGGHQGILGLDK